MYFSHDVQQMIVTCLDDSSPRLRSDPAVLSLQARLRFFDWNSSCYNVLSFVSLTLQLYPVNKPPTAIVPNSILMIETFTEGSVIALLDTIDPDNNAEVIWKHFTNCPPLSF